MNFDVVCLLNCTIYKALKNKKQKDTSIKFYTTTSVPHKICMAARSEQLQMQINEGRLQALEVTFPIRVTSYT